MRVVGDEIDSRMSGQYGAPVSFRGRPFRIGGRELPVRRFSGELDLPMIDQEQTLRRLSAESGVSGRGCLQYES